jgi:hypothetical protein
LHARKPEASPPSTQRESGVDQHEPSQAATYGMALNQAAIRVATKASPCLDDSYDRDERHDESAVERVKRSQKRLERSPSCRQMQSMK